MVNPVSQSESSTDFDIAQLRQPIPRVLVAYWQDSPDDDPIPLFFPNDFRNNGSHLFRNTENSALFNPQLRSLSCQLESDDSQDFAVPDIFRIEQISDLENITLGSSSSAFSSQSPATNLLGQSTICDVNENRSDINEESDLTPSREGSEPFHI